MTIIWVDCAQLEVLRKKMLVLFFRNKDFSCCLNTVGVLNRCGAPVIDFALVLLYYYIHINIYIYIYIFTNQCLLFFIVIMLSPSSVYHGMVQQGSLS